MNLAKLLDPVPWKLIGEYITVAGLAAIVTWWTVHERAIGAQKCLERGAVVVAKNDAHVDRQESAGAAANQKIGDTLHANLDQPIAPAPVYRLQPPTCPAGRGQVLHPPGAGPVADGTALHGADHPSEPPAVWDSAPVVRAGKVADARIEALQAYIRNVCKAPKAP